MKSKRGVRASKVLLLIISITLLVSFIAALAINFSDPTPDNNNYRNENWVYVNVSVTDDGNTYSFIDWEDSLVLWMRMDHNSSTTIYDNSSAGNDGTAYGNATQVAGGKFGKGFEFDGDGDYINISNSNTIDSITDELSISVWVKEMDPSNSYRSILYKDPNLFIIHEDDRGEYYTRIRNSSGSNFYFNGFASDSINVGQWDHYVFIYNSTGICGYQNSILDSCTNENIGQIDLGSSDLIIGSNMGIQYYYNGSIDEVLIFNRSLSSTEIQALYNSSQYALYKNFTNLNNGTYTYTSHTVDTDSNVESTSQRNITIDTVNPTISFSSPTTVTGTQTITWISANITAADETKMDTITIYLYNSSGIISSNTSTTNPFFWNITSLSTGTYYLNASVNDSAGNTNKTSTNTITINLPPTINSNAASPSLPIEDQQVYIYANVTDDNNNLLWVNFTITAPNGTVIVNNQNASSNNGDIWNSSSFNASSIGIWSWNITTSDGLSTTQTSNNFTIASWHTIVGNVSGQLTLQASLGTSLINWAVSNLSGSNIYVADSDSSINFNSLKALSRNTSGSYISNDFEEIDTILKTSNLTDSINSSYTSSGNPKQTDSFTIFGNTINNVPVTNSTNSTNFITGILWDSNDDSSNNEQFDSTDDEDAVFITKVNPASQGRYGTYDYEISIPANLRKYISTDLNTVSIYAEIR